MGMARGYCPVLRDQLFLLPPDMREWLPGGHPVWLVIRAVERHMDVSALRGLRRAGGAGAPGFDPVMLAELLIWAYANGITSSRRIEQLCGTDAAFAVICGRDAPDHSVIARFREDLGGAVSELFAQVLVLCAKLGMGQLGVVALDGTKIAANAGKSANRTEATLRELAAERVAAHAAADAGQDALFGAARGDEVPAAAGSPRARGSRIPAALASLQAGRDAAGAERAAEAEAHVAAARAGAPLPGRRPAAADVEVARLNLARVEAEQQAKVDADAA